MAPSSHLNIDDLEEGETIYGYEDDEEGGAEEVASHFHSDQSPDGSILMANEHATPGVRNKVYVYVQKSRRFLVGRFRNKLVRFLIFRREK